MDKFTLSDILRYIIIGGFLLFGLYIITQSAQSSSGGMKAVIAGILDKDYSWVVILVCCYLGGVSVQGINNMFLSIYRKCSGRNGNAFFRVLDMLFCRYRICRKSERMKEGAGAPDWISTSDAPAKIVDYISLEIESKKKSSNINEHLYLSEMSQGLYISSILLFIFTLIYDYSLYAALLSLAALSVMFYLFSHLYARKFILSIDACRNALDININDYMQEVGVQRVFILMRTKGYSKYIDEAFRSVVDQDYYSINLVVMEDSESPSLKHRIDRLEEECRELGKNMNILYFHCPCGNPAQSSYSIRSIILGIADRDDDIIFILDDDDRFSNRHVISRIVCQMNNTKAGICLVKYNIIGEPNMNISRNGGSTHNNITTRLYHMGRAVGIGEYPELCFASSLGWSKIYRMKILREYYLMVEDERKRGGLKDLVSYEDFPDFIVFLLSGTSVTGLAEPSYLYRKHEGTATRQITETAFRRWRLDQLQLLVSVYNNNSGRFIADSDKFLKFYLTGKVEEIETIINKYNKEISGFSYTVAEFNSDIDAKHGLRQYIIDEGMGTVERGTDIYKEFSAVRARVK